MGRLAVWKLSHNVHYIHCVGGTCCNDQRISYSAHYNNINNDLDNDNGWSVDPDSCHFGCEITSGSEGKVKWLLLSIEILKGILSYLRDLSIFEIIFLSNFICDNDYDNSILRWLIGSASRKNNSSLFELVMNQRLIF